MPRTLTFFLVVAGEDLLHVAPDRKTDDKHRSAHSKKEERYEDLAEQMEQMVHRAMFIIVRSGALTPEW